MPPVATGVGKRVKYKAESTWGTVPAASGSQALRRVSSTLALKKETFESNEILTHQQRQDFRHGVRTVEGAISGELSPGTYEDFIANAVRRLFTAISAISSLSITIAGAGPTYTVTRAAGSWLTDGIKIGQVGRLTAGAFNAANLNKNFLHLAVTATVITVMPLNGVALVAEGPIASATYTIPGKVSFVPASGHVDNSMSIEHWHADVPASEVFSGCKTAQMMVGLPPRGMSTIEFEMRGKDIVTSASEYFTSPTAETSAGILAAPQGLLVAQSGAIAIVTGLDFTLDGNMSAEAVVGSTVYPDIAEGRVLISGNMTALFDSVTLRDYFLNETEVVLIAALATSPAANAEFMSFAFYRIKFGDASKDDGDKSIIQTLPFTALYNSAGGAGIATEATTFYVQDSLA